MQETWDLSLVRKLPGRREWLLTPILLPGEFHGQRSLTGYSPLGGKEWDLIEWLTLSLSVWQWQWQLPQCLWRSLLQSGLVLDQGWAPHTICHKWRKMKTVPLSILWKAYVWPKYFQSTCRYKKHAHTHTHTHTHTHLWERQCWGVNNDNSAIELQDKVDSQHFSES